MKTLILFAGLSFFHLEPATLIYVGDPMCSWCYGFSEELDEVVKHYPLMNFEMVMGGLRPYNMETMVDLADFLTEHWRDVNERTDMPFSYEILKDASITYDTEPPCRANVIVRELDSNKSLDFFHGCQKRFYKDNANMHLAASYHPILKELEIDAKQFDEMFDSQDMKELVRKDFERSTELNANSFPTLLIQLHGEIKVVSRGYDSAENIIERIDKMVKASEH